ncbi:MAG: hypothetical protein JW682_04890 [Campylobacterales bacterium]|nr:hypothetical protein [Campylobacterales bacterium]
MSGIFGIFNRNGEPVEKNIADVMLEAMSYWKPDDMCTWVDGPVVLGHTMLWNTPESKFERLPLAHDTCVLSMDARIDNRDQLLEELDLPDRPISEIGDSEFILAAYKKWGEESPKYLLGDFTFAIWDSKKKQLFCARDHVGVKQFYYHLSDDLCLFGNDLKGLIKYPNISQKINDEAVASYIVKNELISNELTFFKTFKKLPPAYTLIITDSKVEKRSYWKLEDSPKVKLPNTAAYAEKLRELLEKSVLARIRSDYPITSHLSGGLDSSTIAVIAARKLKQKGYRLLAFNWLYEPTSQDDPTYYEWANSKIIAELEDIEHHYVPLSTTDLYDNMKKKSILYGNSAKFFYEYKVRFSAQQKGSRSILSGWGGDEFATYYGMPYYSDLFLRGAWTKLFQELKFMILEKRKSIKSILSFIYHRICVPLMPRKFYCKLPKIRCMEKPAFGFIKKSFLPLVKKEFNKPSELTMQPHKTIKKDILVNWEYGYIQSRIESWATAAICDRVEYSYPLLDKRIIEFMYGVPSIYFVHENVGRYLFRVAVNDLLPKNIVWVNNKSEPKRVDRLLSIMFKVYSSPLIIKKLSEISSDYIDSKKLMLALQRLQDHSTHISDRINIISEIETSLSLLFSLEYDN